MKDRIKKMRKALNLTQQALADAVGVKQSLPTRGAWIEMASVPHSDAEISGRSPHGERGLKCAVSAIALPCLRVAPHTGSVD